MLVGANAPLALEGQRHTHMVHAWDFYKPVGWPSMGPIIDGPGSMELYHKSLAACQEALASKGDGAWVDSHDHLVFHLGSSPKFVRHAFEHALAAAAPCSGTVGGAMGGSASASPPPDADEVAARFERQVAPSLVLASRIGPCHTAATYVNLASLLVRARARVRVRVRVRLGLG